MTQEEKELLIKDLCGRLPYGVMLKHISTEKPFKLFSIKRDEYASYKKDGVELAVNGVYYDWYVNDTYHDIELYIKPYLRPMSSMTEEEKEELRDTYDWVYSEYPFEDEDEDEDDLRNVEDVGGHYEPSAETYDWYNRKGFDYRGLIPKGLALEAKEGMYN